MNNQKQIWDHNMDKMTTLEDKIIDWKNPDGTIKTLNFDDDGNLIGKNQPIEKPFFDTKVNTKYRYYEDPYGNQYRWTTHKQSDGKFNAKILRLKKYGRGSHSLIPTKVRSFTKKKSAIAWLLKAYLKAKERQLNVIKARAIRKQARLDLKPKGKDKSKIEAQEKLDHFRKLSWNIVKQRKDLEKKHKKQLRSLGTRMINYNKKVKYYRKRVEVLK